MARNKVDFEAVKKYSVIRDEMLRLKYELRLEFREAFRQAKNLNAMKGREFKIAS